MRSFNLFLMVACLLFPVATLAQPDGTGDAPSEQQIDERSFPKVVKSAQTAYSNGEYDKAIRELVLAYSMRSNARLLFNIAKSYEKKGECAASLVYYRAYVDHPAKEKQLMAAAKKQMETAGECEAYSEDLAGRLVVDTTPRGATVTVDGKNYGKTPIEVVPLSAGTHSLSIEREGYESVEIDLELKSGKRRMINQILQEEEAKVAEKPPESEVPEEKPPESKRRSPFWPIHPAALALGGAGVGGLTVGFIFDLALIPSTDDKRREAGRGTAEFQRLTDRRNSQETIALIGYVGGGLLLTSGIVWHVIDLTSEQSASVRPVDSPERRVSFGVGPRGVQFGLKF